MQESRRPFSRTLTTLMQKQDIGVRELSRATRARAGWGAPNTISLLMRGDIPPTIEGMEIIAGVLGISPDYFAEYRMAVRRRALDPKRVGFRAALAALDD